MEQPWADTPSIRVRMHSLGGGLESRAQYTSWCPANFKLSCALSGAACMLVDGLSAPLLHVTAGRVLNSWMNGCAQMFCAEGG